MPIRLLPADHVPAAVHHEEGLIQPLQSQFALVGSDRQPFLGCAAGR